MKYFAGVKSLDELKAKYRELCKLNHPDLGGDTATMQEINSEYAYMLKNADFDYVSAKSSAEIEEALREVIEKTIVFEGLIIELCGRWIWFTGETYKWKEQLKALGCFFASKKKAWYWRPSDEKQGRHKPKSLDQIRDKYGRVLFETRQAFALPE